MAGNWHAATFSILIQFTGGASQQSRHIYWKYSIASTINVMYSKKLDPLFLIKLSSSKCLLFQQLIYLHGKLKNDFEW